MDRDALMLEYFGDTRSPQHIVDFVNIQPDEQDELLKAWAGEQLSFTQARVDEKQEQLTAEQAKVALFAEAVK